MNTQKQSKANKKNLTMKISSFKILILFVIFAWINSGCKKEQDIQADQEIFTNVMLPDFMKSNLKIESVVFEVVEAKIIVLDESGSEVHGYIRFTLPDSNDESIIKLEISNNIFEQTSLKSDFLIIAQEKGQLDATKSSCVASCQEKFTDADGNKIKGRGWCKAECWAQTIIKAAAVVVAIAAI